MAGGAGAPAWAERARAFETRWRERLAPSTDTLARLSEVRDRLVARAEEVAREQKLPLVRAIVAGSVARGTFLADRLDIDLFLLFAPSLPRRELEQHGLRLGGELLDRPETRYAEHPYLRGRFEGFSVDAVPGYAIADPAHPQSAVDRTPFHNEYLQRHQTPAMVGEVRLAKQFLRAQGIYGSESRTQGLSGYVVELLILRYGTLDALLEEARGWSAPVRIAFDPASAPRVPEEVALVMDDPVDPHRNVASALSRKNFGTLVFAAQAYAAAPAERFFEPAPAPRWELSRARARIAERGTHVAVLRLPRPKLVDDILYPQLAKAARAIAVEADRTGFAVVGTASAAGPTHLVLLVETEQPALPLVRRQLGPPAGLGRVEAFLAKWCAPESGALQGPYVAEDGRLAVEARREHRTIEAAMNAALPRLALGRDLVRERPEDAAFVGLETVDPTEELESALAELLDKQLPWLRGGTGAAPLSGA